MCMHWHRRAQRLWPITASTALLVAAAPLARAQTADGPPAVPYGTTVLNAAPLGAVTGDAPTPVMTDKTPPSDPAPSTADRVRFRTNALIAAGVGATLAYGRAKWWRDGFSGGFKTVDEGWFGQNTPYGGADKLGHTMFTYTGTRLLARGFEELGNDPARALKLGLWTTVGTMTGVELIDGYSRRWRFSKEDALANLAGGALGYLMETHPALDALLDLRLQYSESTGPEGRRGFDPFGDYSGQRYLLVFKASGVPALREHPLLRYLEFNIGYGTRNYDRESRGLIAPTRHAYVGIALNLTEVLRGTAFKDDASPSRTQRLTETFLEYIQIPAATVQGDHVIR